MLEAVAGLFASEGEDAVFAEVGVAHPVGVGFEVVGAGRGTVTAVRSWVRTEGMSGERIQEKQLPKLNTRVRFPSSAPQNQLVRALSTREKR